MTQFIVVALLVVAAFILGIVWERRNSAELERLLLKFYDSREKIKDALAKLRS